MTPISADELVFDEDTPVGGVGAVSADDLQFDVETPRAKKKKKPAPRKPTPISQAALPTGEDYEIVPSQPQLRFGKPKGFGWTGAGPKIEITPTKIQKKPVPKRAGKEGYRWEREGGQTQMVLNTPRGDSFQPEGTSLTEVGVEPPSWKAAGIQALPGELPSQTLARDVEWQAQEKERERVERAQRAQTRAQNLPREGIMVNELRRGPLGTTMDVTGATGAASYLENFGTSFGTGLGESFRTAGVGLSLLTGQPPDNLALQQPMPLVSEEAARSFWEGKLGQAGGSAMGFGLISALTGPVGVALAGAAQNAGQTYEEAIQFGEPHDRALMAALRAVPFGLAEGIGGMGGAAKGLVKGTAGEIFQETFIAQLGNNINAKILSGYDPQRAITEGFAETAALSGLLGAGTHGMAAALSGRPAIVPSPTVMPQVTVGQTANPSFISDPAERQTNLQAWHAGADPRLRGADGQPIAVYHGTQSPVEIEQLDMGKLDPDALYGPGFYMTQDSEVAAGDGGYANTKLSKGIYDYDLMRKSDAYRDLFPKYRSQIIKDFQKETGEIDLTGRDEQFDRVADVDALSEMGRMGLNIPIQNKPHAYKLYANLQRPFDINAPADPDLRLQIERMNGFGMFDEIAQQSLIEGWKATPITNHDLYQKLVQGQGSKAAANKWLKEQGFDGITHMGGFRMGDGSLDKTFNSEEEAKQYAALKGGQVESRQVQDYDAPEHKAWNDLVKGRSQWIADRKRQIMDEMLAKTGQADSTEAYYQAQDEYKERSDRFEGQAKSVQKIVWDVKGHRVWIAFDPTQVKSATGNQGTFAKGDPRLSASFVADPTKRQANLKAWQQGAHPELQNTDGSPKVFYHGTKGPEITEFRKETANPKDWLTGFYFTENPQVAGGFYGQGGSVYKTYLNIKNPFRAYEDLSSEAEAKLSVAIGKVMGTEARQYFDNWRENFQLIDGRWVDVEGRQVGHPITETSRKFGRDGQEGIDVTRSLKAAGYDGAVHHEGSFLFNEDGTRVPPHKTWVTFEPEQIKSATGNEGTFSKDDSRLSASFTSDQLLDMEVRAAQAGRPVALRPETLQSFHQQIGAINQELMRVDPTSPEFARLADRAIQLRRAVEEAPTPADLRDGRTMREWARKQNMWHDTAAQDLLDMLGITDESGADTSLPGIKADWALYHQRVKSGDRGARFYPLPADNGKGGTVFLSPQSMVDAGIIEAEEVGHIGGMNVPLATAVDYARMAELGGHVDVATAIRGAITEAEQKGLPKVALAMYVPGQGLAKTKQFVRHESFHTGQQVAAKAAEPSETDVWSNPMRLTSQELLYHPIVAKVAGTEGGQSVLAYYDGDESALAFEMAAYAAAKQYNELGWTKEEADAYLADYLLDVLETSGVEALEGLVKGARLSAPVAQQVAKLTEDHYGRERGRRDRAASFAASLRAPSATVGPEGAAGEGGGQAGEVGEGGGAQGGVEGQVDGVSEEQARDYGELDADDLEWDEDDLVDPVEQQLRDVYEAATQDVPPTPPTAPTPTAGGKPGSPLTETVVAKDRYAQLREKLMQAAVAKGYKWDLAVPPGLQLARAIKAGYLDMDNMTEMLARAGMTVADLADLAEFTQHRAGQILNELSKITKEIDDLIDTNPQLASLIIGPNKVMQRGLKRLEATELGHSIWERAGSIMRKNFLSRLATAFTQVWSATAHVPLGIASGAIAGLGMRFLNPAKWQHNTTGMLATAKEDIVRGIEPVLALARGMNPMQITDLLKWQKPAKQMEYKKIVDDLSLIYPKIYGKLHGREDLVEGKEGFTSPAALRQVLSQVKDPTLRREYEVRLRTLEGREKFNTSLRGKALKKYEGALDLILMPLSVQEYAFRRPMFVGALQRELEARGLDLNDFIVNPQKVAGAHDMLQAAVDEALTFTWAYEPKAGNKAIGQTEQAMEGAAHYFIKFWNKMGPIGATLEAFPRALTNGLKFAYEWSPLGFLSPAWQVQDKMRHGARDQITFQEAQRMAQAVVGTMMYGLALGLREWAGGEEWWQLKTGKKNKDGKPVYYDARRIPQLAFFLNAADLAKRASEDTLGDIKVQQRLTDTYLGARRNSQPGDLGAIDQFMLMWTGDAVPTNAAQKSKLAAGQWASTFVIPLSNIRDAWAQFSMEEGAKRDLRESPWLGPSMDKLPWLRRKLPLAEGPFEPSPQLGAYAPLAEGESLGPVTGAFALGGAIGATRMTPGQSFAAREFARLGLSPFTWLKRDPNPAIDRAQWAKMTEIMERLGTAFSEREEYLNATPDKQRQLWESKMAGPDGYASQARERGLKADPVEAKKREKNAEMLPYERKLKEGLDKQRQAVGQP